MTDSQASFQATDERAKAEALVEELLDNGVENRKDGPFELFSLGDKLNEPLYNYWGKLFLGRLRCNESSLVEAKELIDEAFHFFEARIHKAGMAAAYQAYGAYEMTKNIYPLALENYLRAAQLREEIGDKRLAMSYFAISNAYGRGGNDKMNVIYLELALPLFEKYGPQRMVATCYNNLGASYYQSNKELSFGFHKKSLSASEVISDKRSISYAYYWVGRLHLDRLEYSEAKEYIDKAEKLSLEISNKHILSYSLAALAEISAHERDFQTANEMMEKAWQITKEKDEEKGWQHSILYTWYKLKKQEGDVAGALDYLEKYYALDKELSDTGVSEKIAQVKLGIDIENKVKEVVSEKELRKIVEQKNREILDSINYATRIQSTILPPLKVVKSYLSQSFVLYLPKDIVAGDFYWMEATEKEQHSIFFAVCDCTGHGVPGAMVSVVCHNALNATVREYGLRQPAQILDKAAQLITNAFSHNNAEGDEIKDGMDASVCALDTRTLQFQWAGANSPLWVIKPSGELIEYKGNNQSVGRVHKLVPFTNHEIVLEKGDTIYLFSDGFADQFGGKNNKKFQRKALKELLMLHRAKDMEAQREALLAAFENWRGKNEPTDDVCIIGVRI